MSVCNNQDTFNDSVYKALKYSKKKEDNRVVHITLAIIFAPAYCLAYYMNTF